MSPPKSSIRENPVRRDPELRERLEFLAVNRGSCTERAWEASLETHERQAHVRTRMNEWAEWIVLDFVTKRYAMTKQGRKVLKAYRERHTGQKTAFSIRHSRSRGR